MKANTGWHRLRYMLLSIKNSLQLQLAVEQRNTTFSITLSFGVDRGEVK